VSAPSRAYYLNSTKIVIYRHNDMIIIDLSPRSTSPFDEPITIVRFADKVKLMSSKVRPKRLVVLASDGKEYPFLLKQEAHGDLKKDKRMMDIGYLLTTEILAKTDSARTRNMFIRTYNVVCLTEKAGILEWVENTMPMRTLILEQQRRERSLGNYPRTGSYRSNLEQALTRKFAEEYGTKNLQTFCEILLPSFPPVLHLW
jgi:serine/threonine-protein kinase ATR